MLNTEKIVVSDYRGINNTVSYRTFPLCESQIVIIHDIFIPSMFFATIRKIWRNRKHTIIEFLKKHDFAFYSKYIQIWLQIIKPPIHTPTQRLRLKILGCRKKYIMNLWYQLINSSLNIINCSTKRISISRILHFHCMTP